MLGDQLGEERGQVVLRRALPSDSNPKVEVTIQAEGRILDIDTTDMGTYVATVQPDGTLEGEGQGFVRGAGNEVATWKGGGVGHFTDDGGVSWRGAIYYRTQSPGLARLNGIAVLFEYDVDASGKTEAKIFEWK